MGSGALFDWNGRACCLVLGCKVFLPGCLTCEAPGGHQDTSAAGAALALQWRIPAGTHGLGSPPCMSCASVSPRTSITEDRPAHSSARLTEGASGRATTLCVGWVGMMQQIDSSKRT